MDKFRQEILNELDDVHRKYDSTPDHIIVSDKKFESMKGDNKIERCKPRHEIKASTGRTGECGYMGMVLWTSDALDDRESGALLLSNEVFVSLFNDQSKLF